MRMGVQKVRDMKMNRKISALAMTIAVPTAMFSATAANAADMDAAKSDQTLTIKMGKEAADSKVKLLGSDNKELDSQKVDKDGTVTFKYEVGEAGHENLSVEVDGEVIEVTGAKCVAKDAAGETGKPGNGSEGKTPGSGDSNGTDAPTTTPAGDESETDKPGETDKTSGTDKPSTTDKTSETGKPDKPSGTTAPTKPTDGSAQGASVTVSVDEIREAVKSLESKDLKDRKDAAELKGFLDGKIKAADAAGETDVTITKDEVAGDAAGIGDLLGGLKDIVSGGGSEGGLMSKLTGFLSPIMKLVDPIVQTLGGPEAVVNMIPGIPEGVKSIIVNAYNAVKGGADGSEGTEGGSGSEGDKTEGDKTEGDKTEGGNKDEGTPAAVDKESESGELKVVQDAKGFSVVAKSGQDIDCDVDVEAVKPEEETEETKAPETSENTPAPVAPAASTGSVSTPGPKVNTGGDVKQESFFAKIKSVFA